MRMMRGLGLEREGRGFSNVGLRVKIRL